MDRIDGNTVVLTDEELAAAETFDALISEGLGIEQAVTETRLIHPFIIDVWFWKWLGE